MAGTSRKVGKGVEREPRSPEKEPGLYGQEVELRDDHGEDAPGPDPEAFPPPADEQPAPDPHDADRRP